MAHDARGVMGSRPAGPPATRPAGEPPAARATRAWDRLPVVVRYGLAGGVTQIVYLSVLTVTLAIGWHYLAGMALAQVGAIAFAFPTYRAQVFRSDGRILPQFVTFLGVWWTGVALSFVGVPLLVEGAGLRPLPAQIIVLVGVVTMSFLSHRGLTFRARHGQDVSTGSHAPAAAATQALR